jgi:UDP-GlcNAc:undecaprenyl-phosphate GlcNAc-1-phosphate transferase
VALIGGNRANILLTIGLAACILGFLRFNFNPASIFLGDSGSLTIGFILSAIALNGMKSPTLVAVALPLVACGLPIVDTAIAVFRRFIRGKSIFEADKDHIHHKLLNQGLSQKQVVIALYGVSALLAFLSLALLYPGAGTLAVVLAVLGIGGWLGLQQLEYLEFTELKRVAVKTMSGTRAMAANVAVQSAARSLGSASSLPQACDILRDLMEESDFDGFAIKPLMEVQDSSWGYLTEDGIAWRRAGWHRGRAHMQIVISLVDLVGAEQGTLTLFREYSGRPLLVDLDLLTGDLQRNLAESLSRLSAAAGGSDPALTPKSAKAAHAT